MISPLDFAVQLARETGKYLLGCFRRTGTEARTKSDQSVVTEVDLEADERIAEVIQSRYPGEGLLSEELRPQNPAGHPVVWVIDPLDGTTNYSLGLPFWGVSIARLVDGWPETAAIYFPPTDELFVAERGAGAFMNGERIYLSPPANDRVATLFACCSRTHRLYHISVPYKPRILGSAAYNFCSLARGISIVTFEAKAKIWDIAAAWLVVCEAGGAIHTLDGSHPFPLAVGVDYRLVDYPILAAATPELAARARSQIQPK
jgi:myo-inositol-1(or 4)-monophosphatase